jgi:hypothetical protein
LQCGQFTAKRDWLVEFHVAYFSDDTDSKFGHQTEWQHRKSGFSRSLSASQYLEPCRQSQNNLDKWSQRYHRHSDDM